LFEKNQLQHGHTQSEIADRISIGNSNEYLRDMVFGGIDGAVTTFAIVSGVTGAGMSHTVILVLGVANLLADGFSMAAGNYSATRSDLEKLEHLIEVERKHLILHPEGETEELKQILENYGYTGSKLEQAVNAIKHSPDLWVDMMLQGEYGVTSVRPNPGGAAIATFGSFLVCGMVPLLPFLLKMEQAITTAALATCLVFFLVGAGKTLWTNRKWWLSGLETLVIGASAAGIAYFCGDVLSKMIA